MVCAKEERVAADTELAEQPCFPALGRLYCTRMATVISWGCSRHYKGTPKKIYALHLVEVLRGHCSGKLVGLCAVVAVVVAEETPGWGVPSHGILG